MNTFSKVASVALLSLALAGSAALAAAGGNGNGNGNGGGQGNTGGNGNGNAGGNGNGGGGNKASKKTEVATKQEKDKKSAARFGKLNGFLHASPKAIANASPKSAIGKIAKVYGGLLAGYLSPTEGETAPTAEQLAAALKDAANKPIDEGIVAAVNAKLLSVNPELAADLEASGKTPEQLVSEIAAAL